jgi:hypothetical protein
MRVIQLRTLVEAIWGLSGQGRPQKMPSDLTELYALHDKIKDSVFRSGTAFPTENGAKLLINRCIRLYTGVVKAIKTYNATDPRIRILSGEARKNLEDAQSQDLTDVNGVNVALSLTDDMLWNLHDILDRITYEQHNKEIYTKSTS